MTNKEELLLIKKSIKDNDSFKLLIKKYDGLISSYANYFYLEGHEVDDIRNIIITTIWKSLKGYRLSRGSFNSYISKRINNTFFILIRNSKRQKRSPHLIVSLDSKEDDKQFSLGEILSDVKIGSYEDKEEFKYLNKMLLLVLSPKERLVYSSLIERYSRQKLADRLKCSIKSINNSLDRIKTKAKVIYERYIRKTRND